MSSLLVKKLFIFDISNKKAKVVPFSKGLNVITSNQVDGNKRGKSLILASIFHCLGSDGFFDDNWNIKSKIYLMNISISDKDYYIYRMDRLFKIFDSSYDVIFKGTDRKELAEFLGDLFNFIIKLPNRDNNILVTAPPAYAYILNYLHQDKMDGPSFNSFKNLGEFISYKENLLYSHFNIYNEDYYKLIGEIESFKKQIDILKRECTMLQSMIEKTESEMSNYSYPKSMELLKVELQRHSEEYIDISEKLSKAKNKLIELRNSKYDLMSELDLLIKKINYEKKSYETLTRKICPTCRGSMADSLDARLATGDELESFIYLSDEFNSELSKVENKISKEEVYYKSLLEQLSTYEDKLKVADSKIEDIFKHKAYSEFINSLLSDYAKKSSSLASINLKLEDLKTKKSKYNALKKDINDMYSELMLDSKVKFGLKELDDKKFKNIRSNFEAGGSNKPISTIIWHLNLLKIKYAFNPDAIKFPIILDSPNNTELDDTKREKLFNFIFSNIDSSTQVILSTLGFSKSTYPEFNFDNIIELDNDPYNLLNTKDYDANLKFLLGFNLS
ncbi:hypothetical protein EUAN_09160 [Andreesenia angusta]|uniref:Chromosome partition protein Smc n=1 Tax=Andreesenia angusta TaxID=39480 RepID=A0A1S1V963_9FIRM|nr:hypothetical protein [Andreesenia angusta]OHW63132.1 hypothetical protein EUAN_09160 [Andreesenia angusta]